MSIYSTTIYICRGKDCQKNLATLTDIEERLDGNAELRSVRCQKICNPQVIGILKKGKLFWVKKIKSRKDVNALKKWIKSGRCPKRLKSRRVKKRMNKLRT
jgi:hypothetical protein